MSIGIYLNRKLSPNLGMNELEFVYQSVVAGLLASVACGLGALPLLIKNLNVERHIGIGYAFAGGLMFSASVYNLLLPALNLGGTTPSISVVFLSLLGLISGSALIWGLGCFLTPQRLGSSALKRIGGRREVLILIAMAFHSIPEGVAVGVGYGSIDQLSDPRDLGHYIAFAIAIHNIPEGLAVAIPFRANGTSIHHCFFLAFLTSLPQPIAAVPASLLVWMFKPLMVPFLGFAAGAMMFLVIVELIPDALKDGSPSQIAWAFILGFGCLIGIQVIL